jgi:hypothetical protein
MAALASKGKSYEESLRIIHKERLTAFYKVYDKSKVSQVDSFLEKYVGKEDALFKALVKKYGPEPTGTPEDADDDDEDDDDEGSDEDGDGDKEELSKSKGAGLLSSAPFSKAAPKVVKSGPMTFKERLEVFYEKYDSSKLDGLDKIMLKYAGAEDKLFEVLVKKYGPEPKPSSTSGDKKENEVSLID